MAARTPAKGDLGYFITYPSHDDESDGLQDSVRVINGRVIHSLRTLGTRVLVTHPDLTDLSAETLARYIEHQNLEHELKEEALKDDRVVAAAEANKNKIRKVVNSSKPVQVRIANGLLKVTQKRSVAQNVPSSHGSEGDNESGFVSSSRPSTGKTVANKSKGSPCKRRRVDLDQDQDQDDVDMSMENPRPLPRPFGNSIMFNLGISDHAAGIATLGNDDDGPLALLDSVDSNQSGGVVDEHTSFDGFAHHAEQTSGLPPSVDPLLDFDESDLWPEDTPYTSQPRGRRYSASAVRDLTNSTNIVESSTSTKGRSLSFERFADGVRQSIRPYEKQKHMTATNADGAISRTESEPVSLQQPAGTAFNTSWHAALSDLHLGILDMTHVGDRQGWAMPGDSVKEQSPISCRSDEPDDNLKKGFHRSVSRPAPAQPFIGAGKAVNRTQHVGHASDAFSFSNNRHSLFATDPQHLTGRDTFFSASSDDLASGSDQGEDTASAKAEPAKLWTLNDSDSVIGNPSKPAKTKTLEAFDYGAIVPEKLPPNIRQARENCQAIWSKTGFTSRGSPDPTKGDLWYTTQFTMDELDANGGNMLEAADAHGQFPRKWTPFTFPKQYASRASNPPLSSRDEFAPQILQHVCLYLSSTEVRTLRLVNRATAAAILPLMIRSTVVKFGRSLFDSTRGSSWDDKSDYPALTSIIRNCGGDINKFGISFDFDKVGLSNAEHKNIEEEIRAWFGTYCWPVEAYPHFPQLKELEDLLDSNRPLLKNAMKSLTNVSELAISVDSGHGWLVGPDISDMAIVRRRLKGGPTVFGQVFNAPDKRHEHTVRQYFNWCQINTIDAMKKALAAADRSNPTVKVYERFLRSFQVGRYDSYRVQSAQPDFKRTSHIGGEPESLPQPGAGPAILPTPGLLSLAGAPINAPASVNAQLATQGVLNSNNTLQANQFHHPTLPLNGQVSALPAQNLPQQPSRPSVQQNSSTQKSKATKKAEKSIYPQWPILYGGFNLAAEIGGKEDVVQSQVSHPGCFPFHPGALTEAQVQWLMETFWAQRAFLSSYTSSIIANAGILRNVHTLNIAKLSSGLLPSLAQKEFWSALPHVKKLTLKVIPDWRQEHVPGDKQYQRNMLISPVEASAKLAAFLEDYIAKIENLTVLRVGFVGGGEHQPGMYARNKHVLPAPIVYDPRAWITNPTPDLRTMVVFNHIRDLTFENCWFHPNMLEGFMKKSRDTSLHHLTLDSVSLTGVHTIRLTGPLATGPNNLKCNFAPGEWLHETIPDSACWVKTLDNISPGKTLLDRKYDTGIIAATFENPQPLPNFRGNIKSITLNSCGYVKVSGIDSARFGQDGVVQQTHLRSALDGGLEVRQYQFSGYGDLPMSDPLGTPSNQNLHVGHGNGRIRGNSRRPSGANNHHARVLAEIPPCAMMGEFNPKSGKYFFGLGKLTQCVHPIEKRVLERAWGLRFGWGDTMERWAAVEDGWFEGGTGRFGGVIGLDD